MYCIYTKDKGEGELKGKYSVRIAGILCSSQLTGYSRLVLLSLYNVIDVEFWSWNWTKEGIVCSFSSGKCYIPLCSTNSVINHHEFYKLQMELSSKAWFPVLLNPGIETSPDGGCILECTFQAAFLSLPQLQQEQQASGISGDLL